MAGRVLDTEFGLAYCDLLTVGEDVCRRGRPRRLHLQPCSLLLQRLEPGNVFRVQGERSAALFNEERIFNDMVDVPVSIQDPGQLEALGEDGFPNDRTVESGI